MATEPILVINVHTAQNYSSLAAVTEPLTRMRQAVASVAQDFPEFKKPVRGTPP